MVMAVMSLTISGTQHIFDCLLSLCSQGPFLPYPAFLMAKDSRENAYQQQRARSCANLDKTRCQTEKHV